MPGTDRDSMEFPLGRWLLWGLLAVAAVAVVLYLLFGNDDPDTNSESPPAGVEQLDWSIVLEDMNGETVTLKGDLPFGFPTETWQGTNMITRSTTGDFEWDVEQELPTAVVAIDAIEDCDALNLELAAWVSEIGAAQGEAHTWQSRAFAQHTLGRMRSLDCSIDESILADI
jgi:hypothetical protein